MAEDLGLTSESYSPDKLIAGNTPLVTRAITLLSGENRTRGALLGEIEISVPTTGTADGGNTGDGTMTSVTGGDETQIGVYTMECIATAADSGTFEVIDPDNNKLDDATVGVAYTSSQINFTINDGATDFALGDKFTVTVTAGSGKYKLSLAAAVDGSEDPTCILAKDTDASVADVETIAYFAGEFSEGNMTFGSGHTFASTRAALRDKGIHTKETTEYFT